MVLSQLRRNYSGQGGCGDGMGSMQGFQAERDSVCKGQEVSGEQGPLQEPKSVNTAGALSVGSKKENGVEWKRKAEAIV